MVNKKTSIKRKKSSVNTVVLKKNTGVVEYSPTLELLNEDLIARAVWECLKDNDPEGVAEVIQIYLDAKERARTFYPVVGERITASYKIKPKKPSLKALAKMVHVGVGR